MHRNGIPDDRKFEVLGLFCRVLSSISPGDVDPMSLQLPNGRSLNVMQALYNVRHYAQLPGGDSRIKDVLCRHRDCILGWIMLLLQHASDNTRPEYMEEFEYRKGICRDIFRSILKNETLEIMTEIQAYGETRSFYLSILGEWHDRRIIQLVQLVLLFQHILLMQRLAHYFRLALLYHHYCYSSYF